MFISRLKKIKREDVYNFNRSDYLRLDANERLVNFSEKDLKQIRKLITNYNLQAYPTQRQNTLDLISKIYKIKKDFISLSPGADSVIKYIFETSSKKEKIITLYPTYGMIDIYAKIYKKKLIKINEENFLDNISNKYFNNVSLIYLAIPNMPSGHIMKSEDLIYLLKIAKKKKILVIIDEAYIDYSTKKTMLNLIPRFDNLVIIKTFSKYFGIAGLRIGFFASSKKNIKVINSVRPPHDLSLLSIEILNYLLRNYKKKDYLKKIKKSKNYIKKYCEEKNIKIKMTEANFFHIFVDPQKVKKIIKFLKKNKILVKSSKSVDIGSPYNGPANTVRVTVGDINQMKIFFKYYLKINELI